jgi:hypothetical protein
MPAGRGTPRDPFKYKLPGMEHKWQQQFVESFSRRLERMNEGHS